MDNLSSGETAPDDSAPAPEAAAGSADPVAGPTAGTVSLRTRLARLRHYRPRFVRPRRRGAIAVAIALMIVALLVAGSRLIVIGGAEGPSSTPGTASSSASAAPVATALRSVDPSASLATRSSPVASASASATPTSSPVPVPTQTSPTAEITFLSLVVDSAVDPDHTTRVFTFTSDGPGAISAQVVASSPMESTTICLAMDDSPAVCTSGGTPGFPSVVTDKHHVRWTATLISASETSPTVDVAFRWPTASPSITLTHGRFQGSPNRDSLRTLTAAFRPRTDGRATLDASWAPSTLDAAVRLTDVSKANPAIVGQVNYNSQTATVPVYSAAVAAGKTYRLELLNESKDGLRPDLDATITFP